MDITLLLGRKGLKYMMWLEGPRLCLSLCGLREKAAFHEQDLGLVPRSDFETGGEQTKLFCS